MPSWDYVDRLTAKPHTPEATRDPATPVRLVGIDLPLADLVALTFKLFIAGLPLGIVLAVIWYLLTARTI